MGYLRAFFWILFPLFLPGCYLQQYQWKCSPLDENNLYTLPSLGESDSDFLVMASHGLRLRSSSPGVTYIYPVNSAEVNCSGTVTALDFCYRAFASDLGSNSLVFTLSLLQGNGGIDYTVTNTVEVRGTSSSSDCSSNIFGIRFCCELFTLSPQDQFNLPSPNFAFGITIPSTGSINMFGLSPRTYSNLTAGQYQSSVAPVVGGVYSFPSNSLVDGQTLKWLKFLISPLQSSTVAPVATVTASSSSAVEISSPSSTGLNIVEASAVLVTSATDTSLRTSSEILQSSVSTMQASSMRSTEAAQVVTSSPDIFISPTSTVISAVSTNAANSFTTALESSTTSVAVVVEKSTTMINFVTATHETSLVVVRTSITAVSILETPNVTSFIALPTRSTTAVEQSSSSLLNLVSATPTVVITSAGLSVRTTVVTQQSSLSLFDFITETPTMPISSASPLMETTVKIEQSSSSLLDLVSVTPTVVISSAGLSVRTTVVTEQSSLSLFDFITETPTMPISSASPLMDTTVRIERSSSSLLDLMSAMHTSSSIRTTIKTSMSAMEGSYTTAVEQNVVAATDNLATSMQFKQSSMLSYRMSSVVPTVSTSTRTSVTIGSNLEETETTAKVDTSAESGINIALIGGIAGGGVALVLIICLTVCTAVIIMRRRKRKKWTTLTRPGTTFTAGFQNELFGSYAEVDEKATLRNSPPSGEYDYAGYGPQITNNSKLSEGASPEVLQDNGYEFAESFKNKADEANFERTKESARVTESMDEYTYVAPAKEEKQLYSQIRKFDGKSLSRSSIKLGKLLGSGQFGDVYQGTLQHSIGSIEVAVKTLKHKASKEDRVKFLQEAAIMGQFKHPNVVTMYGVVTDGEPVLLVLEMLMKGDLRQFLLSMRSEDDFENLDSLVDGQFLLNFCRQIASGMAYLSSISFVHRDLAARNVLVSADYLCKIADFGMSRDLAEENYYLSQGGGLIPVKWMAPEALHYKKYSSASDVWSFGVILYEIWSIAHKPFEGLPNNTVLQLLDTGYRMPPPPGCPRAIYTIMMSCWALKAKQRPLFSDLCNEISMSDSTLLHWSSEDRVINKNASKLGADIKCSDKLYRDIQFTYVQKR